MQKEEYEAIIGIIDADIAASNLEDLKKLRNYLNSKICSFKEPLINIDDCYSILTMKLQDFLDENIKYKWFKKVNFLMAMKKILKVDYYDDIYVFDTLGISRKLLLKMGKSIGEKSLDLFENSLKDYGIERNHKIPTEERKRMNEFRKKEKHKTK